MKIVHRNFVYEAVGKVYTEQDIRTILEESGVSSLSQLHALLEAIEDKNKKMDEGEPNPDDVPDLQPTPEEKEIEDKQQAAQTPQEAPVAPEGGSEVPPIETEPVAAPEVPVEPEKPVEEPAPEIEPEFKKKEPKKPEEKKKITKEPVAIKEPPAIEPEKKLPKEDLKEEMWLKDKQLGTLYNNFTNFPHADKNMRNAGTIIGLQAPGLKNDSKYLQADITAFVQGNEEEPYSVWMKLRRKRTTQNWSTKCGVEVRCTCKFFHYAVSHGAVEGHFLAGKPIRNKRYRDENGIIRTINYMLPYTDKGLNPQGAKIICKHLALLTRTLIDKGLIEEG
jgi:hypothetical protein